MEHERRLKVRETADGYAMRQGRETSKPGISLQGAWLAEAGFEAGVTVRVRVEKARLVVELGEV